mmetsp:Transcript_57916/g.135404  ORF Transcript_57916/g.135404 Transcript_57916/m.135404 type:complete len:291 (+) Transcript_57916:1828-2700(+)
MRSWDVAGPRTMTTGSSKPDTVTYSVLDCTARLRLKAYCTTSPSSPDVVGNPSEGSETLNVERTITVGSSKKSNIETGKFTVASPEATPIVPPAAISSGLTSLATISIPSTLTVTVSEPPSNKELTREASSSARSSCTSSTVRAAVVVTAGGVVVAAAGIELTVAGVAAIVVVVVVVAGTVPVPGLIGAPAVVVVVAIGSGAKVHVQTYGDNVVLEVTALEELVDVVVLSVEEDVLVLEKDVLEVVVVVLLLWLVKELDVALLRLVAVLLVELDDVVGTVEVVEEVVEYG